VRTTEDIIPKMLCKKFLENKLCCQRNTRFAKIFELSENFTSFKVRKMPPPYMVYVVLCKMHQDGMAKKLCDYSFFYQK